MSYLILYIDAEFIVGTVCADDETMHPILYKGGNALWLYFYNDPHQSRVTFGKEYKPHFEKQEFNYYGRLFRAIEQGESFTMRSINHPIIELLEHSGLLTVLKDAYIRQTPNSTTMPTLIAFSPSIDDDAQKQTVGFLNEHGFSIEAYTTRLSELICFKAIQQKRIHPTNEGAIIFMETTGSDLLLTKIICNGSLFYVDGTPQFHRGFGIDPRKQALLQFVVNEVNKQMNILSKEDKENECEHLEMQADEWLKLIDAKKTGLPIRISGIKFAKAPQMQPKEVNIRKTDLESDTRAYSLQLCEIFRAFQREHVQQPIVAVFLLGRCFQNELVHNQLEGLFERNKLFFLQNKDIVDHLSVYIKRMQVLNAIHKKDRKSNEAKVTSPPLPPSPLKKGEDQNVKPAPSPPPPIKRKNNDQHTTEKKVAPPPPPPSPSKGIRRKVADPKSIISPPPMIPPPPVGKKDGTHSETKRVVPPPPPISKINK
jgi:hypothetical protein